MTFPILPVLLPPIPTSYDIETSSQELLLAQREAELLARNNLTDNWSRNEPPVGAQNIVEEDTEDEAIESDIESAN